MKNYSSHMEPIKSPNCDVLVGYYVKVFVSTPIKSLLIQNNFEERFRTLSYWINNFYKYNIENSDLLEHLHILLDCLVDCYIIQNSSLPIHVLINKEKLADIAFIIVSICKNAFANSYNLQRFLSYSQLPYLKIIVCQFRLHELIKGKSLPIVAVPLSLYTIVSNEVDLKATDNESYTPLHFAVLMNSKEIVQYLLTLGGLDLLNWSNNLHMKLTKYITSNHMKELLENFGFLFKIEAQEFPECLSPFDGIFLVIQKIKINTSSNILPLNVTSKLIVAGHS
ncbi:hypothetical protein CDAR_494381 [Caerostris darwini]|uniref:Ankyrin repeat protein n=1 Tax=Caerostris darwini TaxID=1538125 RepID=A0AAV4VF72_9ARAC|nr:hypothetical protein CDAR_494381 [Caerostris darwini]